MGSRRAKQEEPVVLVTVPCPTCYGQGWRTCQLCNGKGTIEVPDE